MPLTRTSGLAWFWRMPWPLPALLAWAGAWSAFGATTAWGAAGAPALAAGMLGGALLAVPCQGRWRRLLAAGGFPLSALALGHAAAWPPWLWLLPALPLALLYPLRAWRDAPFYPTPAAALHGLAAVVGTPAPRRVLDAGCGLGHGLAALQAAWPQAQLEGVEWSHPLRWAAALRCPAARVQQGDMWAADWSGFDLVYLFQRPESMARAWRKACAEMAPGSWLVSLEFAVPDMESGAVPAACLQGPGRRPVWAYRVAGGLAPGGRAA